MAYLKRSDREEPASSGRGNKPHGDGFVQLRPSQVMRPMSRKGCSAILGNNEDDVGAVYHEKGGSDRRGIGRFHEAHPQTRTAG